ncbi:FxsA family protein [Stappia sp. WLB 29]|uniref:FxsA family protein n=1 Tax=Stappia sp. WLB 29 TaxID=2925220 RepID=UPI0020BFC603|nr:FxsA family protein [Stappia sp. WLB 29]
MPIGLFILLAIIGLPLLEILVFVEVGSEIGAVPTVLLTIATAVAGSLMLRLQGLSLLRRVRAEMDRGQVPGEDIMQGALIVVASVLLLIPGFVTDALGLLLFVPPLRAAIARIMVRNAKVTVVRAGARRKGQGEGVVDLDRNDWTDIDGDGKGGRGPDGSSPWRGQIDDGRGDRP